MCFNNVSSFAQHNWVLVREGTGNVVAQRGMAAGTDNDYVQPADPDVIAHTKLLNPGETGEVRFTAPPLGTYQFVCTFPGHNFTMSGDFAVLVAVSKPPSIPSDPSIIIEIIEDLGILRIKRTQDYQALADEYGSDHVSVKAVNLDDEDEAAFLKTISDGFLVEPGCIIVVKARIGGGFVYQLDEELEIVHRITLSQFEEGIRSVDARTMENFYSSLQ